MWNTPKNSKWIIRTWCGVLAVWLAGTASALGQHPLVLSARLYGAYQLIRAAAYRNDTLDPAITRLMDDRFSCLTRTNVTDRVAMTFRKSRRRSGGRSLTYPSCQLMETITGYEVYGGAGRLGTLVADTLTLEVTIQDVVTGVIYRTVQIAVRSPLHRIPTGKKNPHVGRG